MSCPVDIPRDRMDSLAAYTNKLLQDGQVGIRQERVVNGSSALATNKSPILNNQFACRMDNDSLVVPNAVNMCARLYEDWIRQGRCQRRDSLDAPWIPTRQYRESRACRSVGEKFLVEDVLQNPNRRLNEAKVLSQLGGI